MTPAPPPTDRPVIAQLLHRLDYAGAEVLAADLARALRDGFRFVFLVLDGVGPLGERLRDEGFEVVELGRRPGLDRAALRRVRGEIERVGARVVHAHQYTPFFYASAARGVRHILFSDGRFPAPSPSEGEGWGGGRRSDPQSHHTQAAAPDPPPNPLPQREGEPTLADEPHRKLRRKRNHWRVLFTEHGRHVPDVVSRKRRLANRWLLGPGDRVTAVSGYVRRALIDHERLPADRIDTVYNGITPEPPPPREAGHCAGERGAARRALGIAGDGPVVIQSARLHPVKDHATALRAWRRVVERRPDATLVLLGDGALRGELEALAASLGIAEHVHFTGQVPDVRSLLPAADIALLSSVSEGLSVSLLEAMAAGLPVVATDVGGNPELVVDGETGLLTTPGDDAALAEALVSLLDDADRRAAFGAAGRARLVEHFTAERMHTAYAERYRAMLV